MDELKTILSRVADDDNITPFKGGEIGCSFFRIRHKGQKAVLKAGDIRSRAGSEIERNYSAYEEMDEIGISQYVAPKIYGRGFYNGILYLILEDAGEDFRKSATLENIIPMTDTLITSLDKAYRQSKRENPEGAIGWLTGIKDHMKKYFVQHLKNAGYVKDEDIDKLESLDLDKISPKNVAWSTADLTPDNVFVNNNRVIIIDPMPNALGVPTIDLAMFSTLAGEVYNLPNGDLCAEKVKNFAGKISTYLGYDNSGSLLFKFGQARQYALSSRFRIGKDSRAESFARKSVQKIEEILEEVK